MRTLTKLEKEILLHRVDSGVIAGVLEDEGLVVREIAEEAETSVAQRIRNGNWANMSYPEQQVLIDAVEGSTWIGTMIGNEPEAKIARHAATLERLGEWVAQLTGQPVHVPCG